MNNKKKPSWFRKLDFAVLVGIALALVAFTIYASAVGIEGSHATEAIIASYSVAVTFLVIFGRLCLIRKKWLDEFKWYPTYGFMVHPENYKLLDDKAFDDVVSKTISKWSVHYNNAQSVVDEEVIWVWFKKSLDENANNKANRTVNGLTISFSHTMMVDYDTPSDDINITAFAHELGHLIMGHTTHEWDLETHHKFMGDNGLL